MIGWLVWFSVFFSVFSVLFYVTVRMYVCMRMCVSRGDGVHVLSQFMPFDSPTRPIPTLTPLVVFSGKPTVLQEKYIEDVKCVGCAGGICECVCVCASPGA